MSSNSRSSRASSLKANSSRANLTGRGRALAATAGLVAASAIFLAILAASPGLAQTPPPGDISSLKHDSDKARELKEPSFQTREERLNAKPLDWHATIGTPKPRRPLTDEERRALETAKPGSSEAGAPNPNADAEARKLHPDDWK